MSTNTLSALISELSRHESLSQPSSKNSSDKPCSGLRIPCVGLELIYTPRGNTCQDGLGHVVYETLINNLSTSGLAFDVVKPLQSGQAILVCISNQTQPTEILFAQVQWCRQIQENHFRVGINIEPGFGAMSDDQHDISPAIIAEPIGLGLSIPMEIPFVCPACQNRTIFTFHATQHGRWREGILPLYNCNACGTTRTILSLFCT